MSAILAPQAVLQPKRVISRQLANGSSVTYTEIPDTKYSLRYDVMIDGTHRGQLVLLKAPHTGENLWLTSSADGKIWSPPVNSEREAARFLLPSVPAC